MGRPASAFSALQRAEIAEIALHNYANSEIRPFSALQRAEIAEIRRAAATAPYSTPPFSALQRAEIAEILVEGSERTVIFAFSALQRAEIAEIAKPEPNNNDPNLRFQCSSTSRNC